MTYLEILMKEVLVLYHLKSDQSSRLPAMTSFAILLYGNISRFGMSVIMVPVQPVASVVKHKKAFAYDFSCITASSFLTSTPKKPLRIPSGSTSDCLSCKGLYSSEINPRNRQNTPNPTTKPTIRPHHQAT